MLFTFLLLNLRDNLVPRVSLLCLPWSLEAAGHVTTQNLGGKKICWVGGVAEYCLLLWQTWWVSNPPAVARDYSLYPSLWPGSGFEVEFADEECYMISAVFKI